MRKTMTLGFLAGTCGGVLGIGGALILIPAWISMGIDKEIATSSTGVLIFSSAFISAIVASFSGLYEYPLKLIFYFVLAYCSAHYIKSIQL